MSTYVGTSSSTSVMFYTPPSDGAADDTSQPPQQQQQQQQVAERRIDIDHGKHPLQYVQTATGAPAPAPTPPDPPPAGTVRLPEAANRRTPTSAYVYEEPGRLAQIVNNPCFVCVGLPLAAAGIITGAVFGTVGWHEAAPIIGVIAADMVCMVVCMAFVFSYCASS